MPLAKDVDLDKLSHVTHGFVGADLEALCREAAMNALRKIMPKIDFQLDEIPYETLLQLEVTMNDFGEALKEVEPSAIREVFVEVPNVKWKDVGGLDEVKQKLIEAVEWPLKYPDLFQQANTKPPKGILLSGPPGTGKTLVAKALANESEVNFISVKGPELMSKYVGESERGVREVFRKAKQASPCILFFDEFDSLVPERGLGQDSQATERVISQFLTELDGLEELKGVLVLAATNRKDLIDSAILRPGRFDFVLEFPLPDEAVRQAIFRVHTQWKPLADDVNLQSLAKETEGMAGSDIEAICRQASLIAIREFVQAGHKENRLLISQKHFDLALQWRKGQKGE
jgi:transitional endoplasmic reticulum ATPase